MPLAIVYPQIGVQQMIKRISHCSQCSRLIHHCLLFWRDVLLWHMRRRKNSCLCSLHGRSRAPAPSVLLLKHYLVFQGCYFCFFFPQMNWSFFCISSLFNFHHHGRQKLDRFSTCAPMWLIQYSCSDLSQQLTFNCRGALIHTGLLAFSSVSGPPCSHTGCAQNKLSEP